MKKLKIKEKLAVHGSKMGKKGRKSAKIKSKKSKKNIGN